ncbi:hypothetical protein IC614_00055 [Allosphingosinicella flava]|uniref:Uncharacterized protein n=1 Tax=Allosphingosinicella flava TaxID=2771430 RepID=A0A7T2GJL0_9SPHN|nr:hypothetical protein [Sphingosinicella flava]QPQ55064.1 hypothetical protein IC614_00055 [Sphingosinicella flava]
MTSDEPRDRKEKKELGCVLAAAALAAGAWYLSGSEYRPHYAVSGPIKKCLAGKIEAFEGSDPDADLTPKAISTMEAQCAVEDYRRRNRD